MTVGRCDLSGAAAIVKRDFLVFTSYRLRFLSEIVCHPRRRALLLRLPTRHGKCLPDLGRVLVLTAGLVILPIALRQELVAGTFERVLVSAFGPIPGLLAMSVFPFLSALLGAVITITVAALVFAMSVEWSTAALALPVAVLGYLAFLPFAVLTTAAVFLVKQAGAGAGLVVTCLSLVAGVFFPVSLLPDWIEWASEVQPLTPALDLLRHLIVGTQIDSAWGAAGRLVGFAGVLFPVSILVLRACLRHAQRRGTVLEY